MSTYDDGMPQSGSAGFETDFDNTVQNSWGNNDDSHMSKKQNRAFYYSFWLIIYCIFSWIYMIYVGWAGAISGGCILFLCIIISCIVKCCYGGCAKVLGLLLIIAGLGYLIGPIAEFAITQGEDGSVIIGSLISNANDDPFVKFLFQFVIGIVIIPSLICIFNGLDLLTELFDYKKFRIMVTGLILVITAGLQAYANYSDLQFDTFRVDVILCISFTAIVIFALLLCILIFCIDPRKTAKIAGLLITLFSVIVFGVNGYFWVEWLGFTEGNFGEYWGIIFASIFIYPILYIALGIGLILE